jgi:hypothetical protein
MAKHEDLDFPHTRAHCDDCWDQGLQSQILAEMRRANDLKHEELLMKRGGQWVEEPPPPRPTYILPQQTQQKPQRRGGMSVDPRE